MLHVISQDRMTKYTITGYTFFRDGGRHKAIAGFGIDEEYYKKSIDRLNGINSNGQISIFANFDKL